MRYISVCSGIEAATVAWHDLGWEPVAFAEIDPFPSAVPASIERVRELERQRDWLIRYAWIDTNAPCPYEMGHFDQKKICPCWTPYHDWEKAEDMSRDDWHDLLMEGVMTEEDKVNCATDFCECLLVAAEQAAKEAGE